MLPAVHGRVSSDVVSTLVPTGILKRVSPLNEKGKNHNHHRFMVSNGDDMFTADTGTSSTSSCSPAGSPRASQGLQLQSFSNSFDPHHQPNATLNLSSGARTHPFPKSNRPNTASSASLLSPSMSNVSLSSPCPSPSLSRSASSQGPSPLPASSSRSQTPQHSASPKIVRFIDEVSFSDSGSESESLGRIQRGAGQPSPNSSSGSKSTLPPFPRPRTADSANNPNSNGSNRRLFAPISPQNPSGTMQSPNSSGGSSPSSSPSMSPTPPFNLPSSSQLPGVAQDHHGRTVGTSTVGGSNHHNDGSIADTESDLDEDGDYIDNQHQHNNRLNDGITTNHRQDYPYWDEENEKYSRIRDYLEAIVEYCSGSATSNATTPVGAPSSIIDSSPSSLVGCMNAIKTAEETYLSIFDPLVEKNKRLARKADDQTQSTGGDTQPGVYESYQLTEDLQTVLWTRVTVSKPSPSNMSRNGSFIGSPYTGNANNTGNSGPALSFIQDLSSSHSPYYNNGNVFGPPQARASPTSAVPSSPKNATSPSSSAYYQGITITSQESLAVLVLYLLWTHEDVDSIRIHRLGSQQRPLFATTVSIPSSTPAMTTSAGVLSSSLDSSPLPLSRPTGPRGFAQLAAHQNHANQGPSHTQMLMQQRKRHVATGRYRITYRTGYRHGTHPGKLISIELAFVHTEDLTTTSKKNTMIIRATNYISRTLIDSYHTTTSVTSTSSTTASSMNDLCVDDDRNFGYICNYKLRPLSVLKLPAMLLDQSLSLDFGDCGCCEFCTADASAAAAGTANTTSSSSAAVTTSSTISTSPRNDSRKLSVISLPTPTKQGIAANSGIGRFTSTVPSPILGSNTGNSSNSNSNSPTPTTSSTSMVDVSKGDCSCYPHAALSIVMLQNPQLQVFELFHESRQYKSPASTIVTPVPASTPAISSTGRQPSGSSIGGTGSSNYSYGLSNGRSTGTAARSSTPSRGGNSSTAGSRPSTTSSAIGSKGRR